MADVPDGKIATYLCGHCGCASPIAPVECTCDVYVLRQDPNCRAHGWDPPAPVATVAAPVRTPDPYEDES